MPWVTDDAPTADELSACVSCGLCLPHCPTFRLTGDEIASPRGRLLAMSAVAEGLVPMDATFEEIMGFCLQCRACEAVCPSLVPFGRAMEGTRAELTAQRPSRSKRARHWVLGRALANRPLVRLATLAAAIAQRLRVDRLGPAPLRGLRGLRRLPLRATSTVGKRYPARGERRGVAALLAGCVMDPWFGEVHQATIGVLRHAGYDVVVPESQTCCGALAAHDGAADEARRLASRNVTAFEGFDLVVVDAAGCGAHLKDYGGWDTNGAVLASRVRDVTEVVAEMIGDGLLPTIEGDGERVAIQDPCHLRHAQRVVAAPRRLIMAAGKVPVEIDPAALCCGAAGVYSLLRPGTSRDLGQQKAAQVRDAAVRVVASANPGCEIQLRSHLGDSHEVRHPVEIYWEALDRGAGSLAGPVAGSHNPMA